MSGAHSRAQSRQSAGEAAGLGPELRLLEQMTTIAQKSGYDVDARLKVLVRWIKQHQCADLGRIGAPWQPRRLLIFTEYADTKRYLQQQLTAAIRGSNRDTERIQTFQGGSGVERREEIKAAWSQKTGSLSPVEPSSGCPMTA